VVNTGAALLTLPLVTVATFKAHPTYLDLANLRSGDAVQADQDAELYNTLLQASQRAENEVCNQPLHAHLYTQVDELRADWRGRLHVHAEHGPVRAVTAVAYGTSLGSQVTMTTPAYRLRSDTEVTVELSASGSTFVGALQLGPPTSHVTLDVTTTYVAAYTNTLLTVAPNAGATSITVADPTGIYPGDILRIWEPGKEESVVVDASWVPVASWPPVAAAVPLAAGLANAHAVGVGVSGLPADAVTGVIYLAVDQLQRPGTTGSEKWPGKMKPTTGGKTTVRPGSVWADKACRLLSSYGAVR